ncbi:MAG: Txe/YoeB family addiction module toxin [Cytophagales bacterium]|nr:MAG: Txe/YoeB family addiction module toxin [Cytophagales bacterium]
MRAVKFLNDTFDDFLEISRTDKQLLKRLARLIEECRRTPFEGIGKVEPLKGNLSGLWSRRITDEHRLVYEVTDTEVIIHSVLGHYE